MKRYGLGTFKRGCAVALAVALAVTPALAVPAFAEDNAVPTNQQAVSLLDVSGQTIKVATQADLDNAAEGSTVELQGTIESDLTVNKKLTITAASDAVMKGALIINANDVTVSGVNFTLDGTTKAANSIRCSGKTGLSVKGCTFEINNGADAVNGQLNSVWLGYGADGATFDDNTFNIYLPGVDQSYVGINIVGATVKDTVISKNQVYFRKDAEPVGTAHFLIANGNETTSGKYGLSGLKVTGNTVTNLTGLKANASKLYGIGVNNVEDATIGSNVFNGLYMAVGPSGWPNEAPSKSIELTGNTFSDCFAAVAMRTIDVQPGAVVSTNNEFGTSKIRYATIGDSNALVWQAEDGRLYPTISDAAAAEKTKLSLVCNIKSLGDNGAIGEGSDVTLDLNGHYVSGTLTNNGTLTIKDSAGLDGATSSIRFAGSGKTVLEGGTYDDDECLNYLAENHGVLVRATDDGSYTYTVLPKESILEEAKGKLTTKDGDLFFATLDEGKDYAEKNGLDKNDVKQATYTVTFDTNGNGAVDSITVEAGKSVTLPSVPKVAGYKDGAWYDGDTKVEGEFTPTSDITLTAKWIKIADADNNEGDNGASESDNTKDNATDDSDSKSEGQSMHETGDVSAALAGAAVAGAVLFGAGVVALKRRRDA